MKVKHALIGFSLITGLYLAMLIWIDSRSHVFADIPKVFSAMPALLGVALLSYQVRFARWTWLLSRAGNKIHILPGFLAYLSGFAFTATPGKVGELLRIRYFGAQGVSSWKVVAAFVYERAFDLVAVLLLASLTISRMDVFVIAAVFVTVFLSVIIFVAINPNWLTNLPSCLRLFRLNRGVDVVKMLRNGLLGCRLWFFPLDAFISLGLGLIAWGLTSLSFVYLISHLGVSVPPFFAAAVYPLAMLAGAASMLPGA